MSVWLERALARKGAPPPPPPPVHVPPPPPVVVAPTYTPPPPPEGEVRQGATFWLQRAMDNRPEDGVPLTTEDQELARILSLPYLPLGMPRCPDRGAYGRSLLNHACPTGWSLREIQIDAAYSYEMYGGLLGPIGVGWGKTLISVLVGAIGLRKRGHRRAILLVPPEVFSQLTERDLPQARRHLSLDGIPFWLVAGTRVQRMQQASQPGAGVFVYTYSSLSTQTGSDELKAICPTLFVLDEAQRVADEKSARTRRLMSTMNDMEDALRAGKLGAEVTARQVEVVALSGTITKKSIKDYAGIALRCLRERSPVPIKGPAVQAFSRAMDAEMTGGALSDLDRERMRQLVEWARLHGYDPYTSAPIQLNALEATRDAFRFRLNTAPGVVATSDQGVDCSLIMSWSEPPRPVSADADRMADLMTKVVKDMKTPDGDVIEFGMHTFKWLWELTSGFYNSLIWPQAEELRQLWAQRGKAISLLEAQTLVGSAQAQHALLEEYHKHLRQFLDGRHHPGCDTPMLVGLELTRQKEGKGQRVRLPPDLVAAYWRQRDARYDDLPGRSARPIRVCSYKIDAAVEWCRQHAPPGPGGIVWWHHPAVGEWLAERLTQADIPFTYAPAGKNEAPLATGIVLASYAHGTGKNLQHQSRNLILELRREAATMEQMLGRTHRSGQLADDVRADVFVSNGFDLALFNAILRDSDYIQATTGQRQRLCYATYAPIIPPTNPRLAYRLGIVPLGQEIEEVTATVGQTITPAEALDFSSVFRSVSYAIASPKGPP